METIGCLVEDQPVSVCAGPAPADARWHVELAPQTPTHPKLRGLCEHVKLNLPKWEWHALPGIEVESTCSRQERRQACGGAFRSFGQEGAFPVYEGARPGAFHHDYCLLGQCEKCYFFGLLCTSCKNWKKLLRPKDQHSLIWQHELKKHKLRPRGWIGSQPFETLTEDAEAEEEGTEGDDDDNHGRRESCCEPPEQFASPSARRHLATVPESHPTDADHQPSAPLDLTCTASVLSSPASQPPSSWGSECSTPPFLAFLFDADGTPKSGQREEEWRTADTEREAARAAAEALLQEAEEQRKAKQEVAAALSSMQGRGVDVRDELKACRRLRELVDWNLSTSVVAKAVEGVVTLMIRHRHRHEVQEEGCRSLLAYARRHAEAVARHERSMAAVLTAMETHAAFSGVQVAGFKLLDHLIDVWPDKDWTGQVAAAVASAARIWRDETKSKSLEVIKWGCVVAGSLARCIAASNAEAWTACIEAMFQNIHGFHSWGAAVHVFRALQHWAAVRPAEVLHGVLFSARRWGWRVIADAMRRHEAFAEVQLEGFRLLRTIFDLVEPASDWAAREMRPVVSAMQTNDSALVQMDGCRILRKFVFGRDSLAERVVAVGGIKAVVAAMRRCKGDAVLQIEGCQTLCEIVGRARSIVAQRSVVAEGCFPVVIATMALHTQSSLVQLYGCCMLEASAELHAGQMVDAGGADAARRAGDAYLDDANVQIAATATLAKLAAHVPLPAGLVPTPTIKSVLQTMRRHAFLRDVQQAGCRALQQIALRVRVGLAAAKPARLATVELWAEVLEVLQAAMWRHGSGVEVQVEGCLLLGELAQIPHSTVREVLGEDGGRLAAVAAAMHRHQESAMLQRVACTVLLLLLRSSPGTELSLGGVMAMMTAMQRHAGDASVQIEVFSLLSHVVASGSAWAIRSAGVRRIVLAMQRQAQDSALQAMGTDVLLALAQKHPDDFIGAQGMAAVEWATLKYQVHVRSPNTSRQSP